MGLIEERLAELETRELPKVLHVWEACPAFGPGSVGSACRLCGAWTMSPWREDQPSCPGGKEAWRLLRPGDRVQVVKDTGPSERAVLGRVFVIERFSRPHGYAIVRDDFGIRHLHPEALERLG